MTTTTRRRKSGNKGDKPNTKIPKHRYTEQQVIDAIDLYDGNVTLVAQSLGCSRKTIYEYAKEFEQIAALLKSSRFTFDEHLLDIAEAKLKQRLLDGEWRAVRYILDKKGRQRGYVERTEHTGADGGAIEVKGYVGWTPEEWAKQSHDATDDSESADAEND